MNVKHALPSRRLMLFALAAILALGAVACSSDDGGNPNAEVLNAVNIMDSAGLHEIDEAVNTRKEIPATAQTTAAHLQTVTLLTDWPKDLEEPAKKLADAFGKMAEALDTPQPDIAKVQPIVKTAHDAQHDFSHAVWEYLAKEAGLSHSASGGH